MIIIFKRIKIKQVGWIGEIPLLALIHLALFKIFLRRE